jgi:hypothetical protein
MTETTSPDARVDRPRRRRVLRAEADLAQISNAATTIPGSTTPYQADPMPVSSERIDHRPLIRSLLFRNVLVQKIWIEEDVLYQYETLQPLLRRLLAALEAEVGEGKDGEGANREDPTS